MKKRSENSPRKSHVFFLDRNLGAEKLSALLRAANITVLTHHHRYGPQAQNIEDPTIIADCGKHRNVLLTADSNLEYSFAPEITSAAIAILLLGNNNEGPDKWAPRIIAGMPEILHELRRRRKPCLIRLSADATVSQVRLYRKRGTRAVQIRTSKARRIELAALISKQ